MSEQQAEDTLVAAAAAARQNTARSASRLQVRMPAVQIASDERIRAYEQQQAKYSLRARIAEAKQRRNVPERYAGADLYDLKSVPEEDRAAYEQARDALRQLLERPGIVALIGPPGSGKTYLACGLINAFCTEGRSAVYTKAEGYVSDVNVTFGRMATRTKSQIEAAFVRPALLVIDEWTARRGTQGEFVSLFALIDKRYDAQRATVIVGNQRNVREFDDTVDARIASRLQDDAGGVIECAWGDLRGRMNRKEW